MERVEPEGASGKFKSALFDRKKIVREDHMAETKTTHRKWIESQGIPILSEFSVPNLNEVKVGRWEKKGAFGAFILLEGVEEKETTYEKGSLGSRFSIDLLCGAGVKGPSGSPLL